MAKITRYNGNLRAFAVDALGTERTVFGEVTQADDLTSQVTADFLRGWGIVGPADQPTLQDFNAMGYTFGQLLAYLHQVGVPEYNATQEYHLNSVVNSGGVIYVSLINTNVGNNPIASPAQWRELYAQATETVRGTGTIATNAEAVAGTSDTDLMTPLKTKAAIQALGAPDASTTVKGVVQLATSAEAQALSNTLKAITPSTLADAFKAANQSMVANGYQKLPGGLILQWATVGAFSGTPLAVVFPTAFPNNVFAVNCLNYLGATNVSPTQDAIASYGTTLSGTNLRTNAGAIPGARMFAIGN